MSNEQHTEMHKVHRTKVITRNGVAGGVYFMTIIGAAIYFIGHATSFWGGVVGFFEALVWPVFVMYKALDLLNL